MTNQPAQAETSPDVTSFSPAERAFLTEERLLGRLATVDDEGQPRVVPLGWRLLPHEDVIDIGGRDPAEFAASRKFRDAASNPKVALVVDDVLPPWHPRAVIVHGRAETILEQDDDGTVTDAHIRITPTRIISWGLEE